MYKRIPKSFISDLVDRANLVDYVSQYASLKRVGQRGEMSTKCPLPAHKDDTPSFFINEQKQTFNCHGCGEGGGIINFIKSHHGLGFVEAVEELADFMNMTIPYETTGKNQEFISYADVYKKIYFAAKAVALEESKVAGPTDVSEAVCQEVGLTSVKPSLIRNVCKKHLKDKPDMLSNVLKNLPEADKELNLLPIKTQYSDSIECLYLFDEKSSFFLPNKPSRGFDKLVYNSHRFSKNVTKEAVMVLPDPYTALRYQSKVPESTAVLASVDEPANMNKKVFAPFMNGDGFLDIDDITYIVYLDEPNIKALLDQYLRQSAEYAARTNFQFFANMDTPMEDSVDLDYSELLVTVLEDKFNGQSFDQAEFARHLEYLLGGNNLNTNLSNSLRKIAYTEFGQAELYPKHTEFEYIKPSDSLKYESLAVHDDALGDIKKMVNHIITYSMDYDSEDVKALITSLKKNVNNDSEKLKKVCLDKLEYLTFKDQFIRLESFLDNLSPEEKEAYLTPIDDSLTMNI